MLEAWWEMMFENHQLVPASGINKQSLSPNTTQYRPLLNDDQEKSSSTMKNWQWH